MVAAAAAIQRNLVSQQGVDSVVTALLHQVRGVVEGLMEQCMQQVAVDCRRFAEIMDAGRVEQRDQFLFLLPMVDVH